MSHEDEQSILEIVGHLKVWMLRGLWFVVCLVAVGTAAWTQAQMRLAAVEKSQQQLVEDRAKSMEEWRDWRDDMIRRMATVETHSTDDSRRLERIENLLENRR